MTKMSLAVMGAGAIGRTRIELALCHEEVRLIAIADPSNAARLLAQAAGVPWFADFQQMLAQVRPEAVSVAMDCLTRGIPVLVEKPIADTDEDARQLYVVEGREPPLCSGLDALRTLLVAVV